MDVESRPPPIARNARLYPWYAGLFNAHFWMPVFFLYFLRYMPLVDVLRLEAVYYLGVVLLEVPSGYFSDRFGRKLTLLISNAAFADFQRRIGAGVHRVLPRRVRCGLRGGSSAAGDRPGVQQRDGHVVAL